MAGYTVKHNGHAVNRGRQSPVPVIDPQVVPLRNGLSVQELKQMTAYRMSQQNPEKWKSVNAPPPVPPKPKEKSPTHETAPSAMPHGLTVEEVKELTRIRLARDKQTQEDVIPKPFPLQTIPATIGVPPTIAAKTIKPRSPDSHDLRTMGTDFESISSLLSAVDAQVQEIEATQLRVQASLKNTNASSHSEQRTQAVARANNNGIVNQRPLQSKQHLLRLAIENRMNHRPLDCLDDSSQFSDSSTTPPLSPSTSSPKSLRNRPKLSVSCPPPVKKRSASDSNDLPYEVAESVLLTPTPLSPRTPRDVSPRVMINRQDLPAGVINHTSGVDDGLFNGQISSSSRPAYTPRKTFWTDFNTTVSQAQTNDPNALIPPSATRFTHTYSQSNGASAQTLHPNVLPFKYNSSSSSSLSSCPATHTYSNASELGGQGLGSRAPPPVHIAGPLRLPQGLGMGDVDAPHSLVGFGNHLGSNGASTSMPDDVSDSSSESDGCDDAGIFSFTRKSWSASLSVQAGISNMKPIERPGLQPYAYAPAMSRDIAEAESSFDVSSLYRALPPTVVLSDTSSPHNGYGAQASNSHTRSRGMPAGMGVGIAYANSQM